MLAEWHCTQRINSAGEIVDFSNALNRSTENRQVEAKESAKCQSAPHPSFLSVCISVCLSSLNRSTENRQVQAKQSAKCKFVCVSVSSFFLFHMLRISPSFPSSSHPPLSQPPPLPFLSLSVSLQVLCTVKTTRNTPHPPNHPFLSMLPSTSLILGRLIRNNHPSLQHSSRSLIHASVYDISFYIYILQYPPSP